ncbi:MAG: cupin domain-containing protein [Rhodospirillaceae bacterium]|nr:cupin domain-containing protein [Rhodospirillaceae bacterium]
MTKGVCVRPPGVGDVQGEVLLVDEDSTRVAELELAPGQALHWHFHTNYDRMYCLSGTVVVETRMPLERHELKPGQHCHVPPRKAHRVSNPADAPARYLIIQAGAPYDFFPIDALNDKTA